MILALSLSPSLDITYEVPELRTGGITRPTAVVRVAGGKALNAARVARALGADVRAVAALGGHTGSWVEELLAADGVAASVVPVAATTRMCAAIVEAEGGATSTDLYEAAPLLSVTEWARFWSTAVEFSGPDVWIALSGSIPEFPEPSAVADLLRELRSRGARIAVDGSGAGLRATVGAADLVKVNAAEAGGLLGGTPDAGAAARRVHERWGCDAIVTNGIRGGSAVIAGRTYRLSPPESLGRFPAGSGDAFLGGLLAGLSGGKSAADALVGARIAAERNARVPGQGVLG